MPTLKLSEVEQQCAPIVIEAGVLTDKAYVVSTVTADTMQEIRALDTADKTPETLAKQLGILLKVSPDEFKGVDLRRLGLAASYITSELNKSFESKKE